MKIHKKDLHSLKSALRSVEGLLEICLLALLYYVVWRQGYEKGVFPSYHGNGKYVLTGVYALLCIVVFWNFEGFRFGYLKTTDVLISQCIALGIINFITYWQLCLIANEVVTPAPMLALTVFDCAVAPICSYLFAKIYHYLFVPKNMVMIYGSDNAVTLKVKMDTRSDKYRITRLIPESAGVDGICKELHRYDGVILTDITAENRNDILKYCYQNEIRTYVAPKLSDIIVCGGENINLFDTPLVLVKGKGLSLVQRFFKRLMDVVLCLVALVVLSPVLLITAIAIKLDDGGPVFYKQKRATRNGKVFEILKFRSMIVDAEKEGKSIPATDHDPRITRVGRFIRATRIDELPQILNILKGDMSIVGPRPERLEHVEQYRREIPEFDYRLKVKGGLTGYAQIYGKYNTSAYDKLRLDLMYIEQYSFMLDIKLILMTLRIMLKKESTEGFDKVVDAETIKQELERDDSEGNAREKVTL